MGDKIRDCTDRVNKAEALEALFEFAPDATILVDQTSTILLVNKQGNTLFGYHDDEIIGMPLETLIPVRFQQTHPNHVGKFFSAPNVREMGRGLDLFGLRKDGTEFAAEISLSPITTTDGVFVAASIRDVTERKGREGLRIDKLLALTREIAQYVAGVYDE